MKKAFSVVICIMMLILTMSSMCLAQEETETIEPDNWAGDVSLSGDGKAVFSSPLLSYSWGVSDYFYKNLNGYPELTKYENDLELSFAIIGVEEGMVDSLSEFAVDAIRKYYSNLPEGCVIAHEDTPMPGFENLLGITTGVCYPTGAPTTFSSVYALTDTENSIVVALTVGGAPEKVEEERHKNFLNGERQYAIDEYFKDILDTFWFGEKQS